MRTLLPTYSGHWSDSRRERNLCHLQIISMLNCSGNKIPLACVFAAIAIVFIHGLSLTVAPGEPEVREPEARAWATAENEPARPKAGVVFLSSGREGRRRLDDVLVVPARTREGRPFGQSALQVPRGPRADAARAARVIFSSVFVCYLHIFLGTDVLVLVREPRSHLPRHVRRFRQ